MKEDTNIVPLYQQIKHDIKAAIQRGEYKPNEKIPPEPVLSEEYSVSRITVRRAIEELSNEGYLVKKQGRGTFVNTPRMNRKFTSVKKAESFTELCLQHGRKAGAHLVDRKIVPVRQDEQKFFGMQEDGLLVYVERIRTADGQPVFLENIFLPYECFKEIFSADLEDQSIFETILRLSGRQITDTAKRVLEITKATPEQAKKLGIPLGEPLFYLNVYFVDQEGRPLCIGRQYYIGSRYIFEFQ